MAVPADFEVARGALAEGRAGEAGDGKGVNGCVGGLDGGRYSRGISLSALAKADMVAFHMDRGDGTIGG